MSESEQLCDPATLRVTFDKPVSGKSLPLKVIRTTDDDASFFVCTTCKRSHLEKANAEKCCEPSKCKACDVEVRHYYLYCERHAEGRRLLKAGIVTESPCDWVYDENGGGCQEGYFDSLESFLDWYADEADEETNRPLYVYACKENRWSGIDLGNVLSSELDDHHEDAGDCLVDDKELWDFIKAWNAKQTLVSFDVDYTKVIPIDVEAFNTLLAELKQELEAEVAA
ncbi:hypothetical protein [Zavarzinella formosa]|uniref:hypothetical protein n=1 Tax=Zavarzinella formosa TaxID=360055 RepID=UPI00030350DC|nr:hypothetical protein [Zavarzinella formosa]